MTLALAIGACNTQTPKVITIDGHWSGQVTQGGTTLAILPLLHRRNIDPFGSVTFSAVGTIQDLTATKTYFIADSGTCGQDGSGVYIGMTTNTLDPNTHASYLYWRFYGAFTDDSTMTGQLTGWDGKQSYGLIPLTLKRR